MIAEHLDDEGYDVVMAFYGTEALDKVKEFDPDLVISDVRMPNGDGVFLLDGVKAINKERPTFVFVTGYSDLADEDAFAKGVDGIFSKPIDFNVFLLEVEKYLLPPEERYKRKDERIKADAKIDLSFALSDEKQSESLNIGKGGFFVKIVDNFPAVGEVIDFTITLSSSDVGPVQGKGVVRWTRKEETSDAPAGVGVQFVEFRSGDIEAFFEHILKSGSATTIPKS